MRRGAHPLARGGTWYKGKISETFGPFGPWLVTKDEVPDPGNLGLCCTRFACRPGDARDHDRRTNLCHARGGRERLYSFRWC
jgi:Fumarylacetoacetate (FAA) hydrolase family